MIGGGQMASNQPKRANLYEWIMIAIGLLLLTVSILHHETISFGLVSALLLLFITVDWIQIPIGGQYYTTLTGNVLIGMIILVGPGITSWILLVSGFVTPLLLTKTI